MYSKTGVISAWSVVAVAATVSTFFPGSVAAHDRTVVESIQVSARGLDLTRPADAQVFYARLQHAAWLICYVGLHVAIAPVDDPKACYEKALGNAVRSVDVPLLTRIYLRTHTLQQAVALGIRAPDEVAAK